MPSGPRFSSGLSRQQASRAAVADQVPKDLLDQGLLYPLQSNILKMASTTNGLGFGGTSSISVNGDGSPAVIKRLPSGTEASWMIAFTLNLIGRFSGTGQS